MAYKSLDEDEECMPRDDERWVLTLSKVALITVIGMFVVLLWISTAVLKTTQQVSQSVVDALEKSIPQPPAKK